MSEPMSPEQLAEHRRLAIEHRISIEEVADDLIAEIERLRLHKWIPVTEALPPEKASDGYSDEVLVWPRTDGRSDTVWQTTGEYNYRTKQWTNLDDLDAWMSRLPVTHWMVLPPGPGEDA